MVLSFFSASCIHYLPQFLLKKVLIITYYWPPSGGAGVQRWLKFVKYLKKFDWEPIVFIPENPEYPMLDDSFEKDIPADLTLIKCKIWEPYGFYKRFIGQKQSERVVSGVLQEQKRKGWAQKLALWIRGNLFIPDARKFWINPAAHHLINYLKNNPVDVIVSNGPPHSMHLIARKVKKATGLPWLADFRDPWSNIDFAEELSMSRWAKHQNKKLEKLVLQEADVITVVGDWMKKEFSVLTSKPIEVITNGYDTADFENWKHIKPNENEFTIVHTGSLNQHRNQPILWEALSELINENEAIASQLKIKLIGKTDQSVRQSIDMAGLTKFTEFIDYIPHAAIIEEQRKAHVLFLSINNYGQTNQSFLSPKATLTGKVFEYFAAERPILMIGPKDGQLATIVCQLNQMHQVVDFYDAKACKESIILLFKQKQNPIIFDNDLYSRKKLTENMSKLLNSISK